MHISVDWIDCCCFAAAAAYAQHRLVRLNIINYIIVFVSDFYFGMNGVVFYGERPDSSRRGVIYIFPSIWHSVTLLRHNHSIVTMFGLYVTNHHSSQITVIHHSSFVCIEIHWQLWLWRAQTHRLRMILVFSSICILEAIRIGHFNKVIVLATQFCKKYCVLLSGSIMW